MAIGLKHIGGTAQEAQYQLFKNKSKKGNYSNNILKLTKHFISIQKPPIDHHYPQCGSIGRDGKYFCLKWVSQNQKYFKWLRFSKIVWFGTRRYPYSLYRTESQEKNYMKNCRCLMKKMTRRPIKIMILETNSPTPWKILEKA